MATTKQIARCFGIVSTAIFLWTPPCYSGQQNFNGSSNGSIENAVNYDGGSSVPVSDTTSDVLAIDAVVSNQPTLTKNRSLAGLLFSGTSGGFTLSSSGSTAFTLTLGSGGIQSNNSSGINTIGTTTTNNIGLKLSTSSSFSVAGGGTLLINAAISGTASLNKTGQGTLTLGPVNQNFGGAGQTFTITDGAVSWGISRPFGQAANTINIGSSSSAPSGTIALKANSNSTLTTYTGGINVNRDFTFNGDSTASLGSSSITLNGSGTRTITNSQSGTLTIGGSIISAGSSVLDIAGGSDMIISGSIKDGSGVPLSLKHSGGGTLMLTGSSTNTYSGITTISAGTLALGKTAGTDAVAGNIVLSGDGSNNGAASATLGVLRLDANNQINGASSLTLAGGTFSANGHNEGLGTLTQSASTISFIDLGANNTGTTLSFADSRTTFNFGDGAGVVNVTDWTGNLTGGGADQLLIGTGGAQNLSSQQLAQIFFLNPAGMASGSYHAQQLSSGELVPGSQVDAAPEPSSTIPFVIGLVGTGALIAHRRRKP